MNDTGQRIYLFLLSPVKIPVGVQQKICWVRSSSLDAAYAVMAGMLAEKGKFVLHLADVALPDLLQTAKAGFGPMPEYLQEIAALGFIMEEHEELFDEADLERLAIVRKKLIDRCCASLLVEMA